MSDLRLGRKDASGRDLVDCDYLCQAYDEPDPDSPEELRAALDHWRSHGLLSGCSHAC